MKKHIVAPLVLLSSITLLTSCMETTAPVPAVQNTPEATVPVEVITESIATGVVVPVETVTPVSETTPAAAPITHTEVVNYQSPAGSDPVEFSVTITDGIITAASATPKSTNEISAGLQTAFSAEVAAKVVGKNAKDLDVDAIGWASLTTAAFEQFVHSF